MRSKMLSAVCGLAIVAVSTLAGTGDLLAQATTRVSVDSQGGQADGGSGGLYCDTKVLSADGRVVAFESFADNLVPGDTNLCRDVFIHDRETGVTTRVSVDSQGAQANGESFWPAISDDGRFVVFESDATNLIPGDTNRYRDVFVHDCLTQVTERVNVSSQGEQANNESQYFPVPPAISSDGRFVAFNSAATNLVPDDTNHGAEDIFLHDRQTGETTIASLNSAGLQANDNCFYPAFSIDGRFVAFESDANNLVAGDTNGKFDIFVHDRQTGETIRISVDSVGVQGNGHSAVPAISADGRFVAFESWANNLVPGDTNQVGDVFVHDSQSGETTRVSVDSQGQQGDARSDNEGVSISANGRLIAFWSVATNFVPDDDWNTWDIFVHDRQTARTTCVSVDPLGFPVGGDSASPCISADGRFVSFFSSASNLVAGDTNDESDAFIRDLTPGPCSFPASWTSYGSGWPGTSGVPVLVATNPVLCATVAVTADNSYGADIVGVLLAGFNSANLPTAWGGMLLVRPAMVSNVLVPAGGYSFTASIPCDDSLCGLALYVQVVEMDPGASRGVSFTPGLELRLGVQ